MNNKIRVNYFQRKPRKGFNFSLERIFEDLRFRLKNKVDYQVYISPYYNDGYLTKFKNILKSKSLYDSKAINHITGETHFLNLLMGKNNLLTILDCGMVRRKKGLPRIFIIWLYLKLPVKRAKYVTAISEETKKDILKYVNCKEDKIKVIPVAVSESFIPFKKEFNSEKPVILHIGTGYNKNLIRLIKSLKNIPCHLIIIGKLNDDQVNELLDNKIDYANRYNISDEEMIENYRKCDILSFVSTFEGFGMPIIEANCVERVVVTSKISSMPEVAGGSAHLVDPFDIADIENGFKKVISDANYRHELINKGKLNRQKYLPEAVASQYFHLYKNFFK